MIPEPPDGTVVVVVRNPSPHPDVETFPRVLTRSDSKAQVFKRESAYRPDERWFERIDILGDISVVESLIRWSWEELQTMGTLHHIGPELKDKQ